LSKVENALEARLWDQIFTWAENQLGLKFGTNKESNHLYFSLRRVEGTLPPHCLPSAWLGMFFYFTILLFLCFFFFAGTIKSCVLIENILATFEMESILYELRHHTIGLNCGIWDYSASIISLFGMSLYNWCISYSKAFLSLYSRYPPFSLRSGRNPDFVISDRIRYVNIDQTFLLSYIRLLVKLCHKRGALATGGMAALMLPEDSELRNFVLFWHSTTSSLN
jgi:hypothetical protein